MIPNNNIPYTSQEQGVSAIRIKAIAIMVVLAIVLLFACPILYESTDLMNFLIPSGHPYAVAVEIDGKLYQVGSGKYWSAVNRKGEFLMELYSAEDMNFLLTLFVDQGALKLYGSDNPYYSGTIGSNDRLFHFVVTETVYDSPSQTSTQFTFRNQSEKTIWTYNPNKERFPKDYFDRINFKGTFMGSESAYPRKYFNFSRFVAEKFDVKVNLDFDIKARLIIFKIPLDLDKLGGFANIENANALQLQ